MTYTLKYIIAHYACNTCETVIAFQPIRNNFKLKFAMLLRKLNFIEIAFQTA
jgi:hypothetical protein